MRSSPAKDGDNIGGTGGDVITGGHGDDTGLVSCGLGATFV
jgi:hypothetical protein